MKNLLIITLVFFISNIVDAQECIVPIDLGNGATYSVVNGDVGKGGNKVDFEEGSGSITSTEGTLPANPATMDIEFSWKLNLTGNLDADDTAELQYTINGVTTTFRTVLGDEGNKPVTYTTTVNAPAGATFSYNANFTHTGQGKWTFNDGDASGCPIIPLPVELTRFEAILDVPNVDVEWETALEINNNYFAVERSEDGVNFEEIDRVFGAGNSKEAIEYAIVDYSPIIGTSYYRLKQVDYDGTSTISKVVSIDNQNANEVEVSISVFPNPASRTSDINVQLEGFQNKEVLCSLIDAYGIEIYSFVVLSEFNDTFVISSSALPLTSGVYFVRGSVDETLFSQKLVVQ